VLHLVGQLLIKISDARSQKYKILISCLKETYFWTDSYVNTLTLMLVLAQASGRVGYKSLDIQQDSRWEDYKNLDTSSNKHQGRREGGREIRYNMNISQYHCNTLLPRGKQIGHTCKLFWFMRWKKLYFKTINLRCVFIQKCQTFIYSTRKRSWSEMKIYASPWCVFIRDSQQCTSVF